MCASTWPFTPVGSASSTEWFSNRRCSPVLIAIFSQMRRKYELTFPKSFQCDRKLSFCRRFLESAGHMPVARPFGCWPIEISIYRALRSAFERRIKLAIIGLAISSLQVFIFSFSITVSQIRSFWCQPLRVWRAFYLRAFHLFQVFATWRFPQKERTHASMMIKAFSIHPPVRRLVPAVHFVELTDYPPRSQWNDRTG